MVVSQQYRYIGVHFGGPKALQDDGDAEIDAVCAEAAPPTCALINVIAGPPKQIQIGVQDTISGLASITVTSATNIVLPVGVAPALTPGTTAATTVTATKDDQSLGAQISLQVTDMAGNVTNCDPIEVSLGRDAGKPTTRTVTGVTAADHLLTIANGTPGVTSVKVSVNGKAIQTLAQGNGKSTTLDLASTLHAGSNTVELTATGKPGGTLTALLHD